MKHKGVSILCPTRGRPDQVKELISTCIGNSKGIFKIEFVFRVDDDDLETIHTLQKLSKDNENIKYIEGPRGNGNLSKMWNECYEKSTGELFMLCGDDIRFRTGNWDVKLNEKVSKYPDKIGFFFTYDGFHGKGAGGTHGFLHKNWVEAVGTFCPPYFQSDFNDRWFNEISKKLDRHIFVDIFTEHLHPAAKKGEWDQTHKDRLERHKKQDGEKIWKEKSNERKEWVKKLKNVMKRK